MPDSARADDSPLYWPIAKLIAAYRDRSLSPVEVYKQAEARADAFNSEMNVYVTRMSDLAKTQAEAAERAYRNHTAGPLAGVPVSIKDAFEVKGYLTTYGSLKYRDHISTQDTGTAKRIRASGAVMTGKTNTAEFGQSATTDNLLGPDTTNAWDTTRTSGGSSGGAASSVAAGLVSVGLGSDGGGSIRIPAAFSGVFGFKPSYGLVKDEGGGSAMDDFVCPGPLAHSVDDARRLLNILAERSFTRKASGRGLKIAVCAAPEDRPVDAGVQAMFAQTMKRLGQTGHQLIEADIPVAGWKDVFGPLVLYDELRERGQYLDQDLAELTDYERVTLEAAKSLSDQDVAGAKKLLLAYRARFDAYLSDFDAILTPTNSVPAFPIRQRPLEIDGRKVSELWGAFPFTSPFNVAGTPAASLPCGLVEDLPVGLQVVMKQGQDEALLNLCEEIEDAIGFDNTPLKNRWRLPAAADVVVS
ncbi:MAG: amidase [Rhodobacteraceae bacterium]|nr:amidase [Paracoccaceae bacterium]